MCRSGSLIVCLHNLDCSGANQVILNIVQGAVHGGNVIILSPRPGPMSKRFVDCGVSIRIGILTDLLLSIRDAFLVICNTIMTADLVVAVAQSGHPLVWIVHEWWTEQMITENFSLRGLIGYDISVVKKAMHVASHIVFVSRGQQELYLPVAPSSVIHVGVPDPWVGLTIPPTSVPTSPISTLAPVVFLVLGIVCPRKNQLWAVELFKELKRVLLATVAETDGKAVFPPIQLAVVGARYNRTYEVEYLKEVSLAIENDADITLHPVTDDVASHFEHSHILLFPSLNEVTPLVIIEAMSYGLPVLSTDVGGISELVRDGIEGYLVTPGDTATMVAHMARLVQAPELCNSLGTAGRLRYSSLFKLSRMASKYQQLMLHVAPPVILIDMDGVLVDWDRGFREKWVERSEIYRSQSYAMEECVFDASDVETGAWKALHQQARDIYHEKGFFLGLPPMEGALAALAEMSSPGIMNGVSETGYGFGGFDVYLCTSPVNTSANCIQEKVEWVREHLGPDWVKKVVYTSAKQMVRGDILIDDKPYSMLAPTTGAHTFALWTQVLFSQPYNQPPPLLSEDCEVDFEFEYAFDSSSGFAGTKLAVCGGDTAVTVRGGEAVTSAPPGVSLASSPQPSVVRLNKWSEWKCVLLPLLGYSPTLSPEAALGLTVTNTEAVHVSAHQPAILTAVDTGSDSSVWGVCDRECSNIILLNGNEAGSSTMSAPSTGG